MSSNVRDIDHVGITVPDIEAATRFFHEAFDAAIVYDTVVDANRVAPPPKNLPQR